MNIRDANINPNRSEQIRNGYVNGAGKPGSPGSASPVEQTPAPQGDRVEISDAGRAAANDLQAKEVNFARKVLNGIPEMSAERAEQIRERITSGYYNQPDVVRKMARSVVADLSGNRQI